MTAITAYYSTVVYLWCDPNMPPDDDGLVVARREDGGVVFCTGDHVTLTDGEGGLRDAIVARRLPGADGFYSVRPQGSWWQVPTWTGVP